MKNLIWIKRLVEDKKSDKKLFSKKCNLETYNDVPILPMQYAVLYVYPNKRIVSFYCSPSKIILNSCILKRWKMLT